LEKTKMHRTTVMLTAQQLRGLKEVGQESYLSMSTLLRLFVTEGVTRRKRQRTAETVIPGRASRRAAILGE
jgi:hypothetical protein